MFHLVAFLHETCPCTLHEGLLRAVLNTVTAVVLDKHNHGFDIHDYDNYRNVRVYPARTVFETIFELSFGKHEILRRVHKRGGTAAEVSSKVKKGSCVCTCVMKLLFDTFSTVRRFFFSI